MSAHPTLKDIQSWLQEAVTSPQLTTQRAESLVAVTTQGPKPTERIGVYSEGWFLRLEESLLDDYPRVSEKLGEEKWEALLHSYLRRCPSSTFNIADVGDRLPGFMVEWDPSLKATYLCDLAVLERAIYKVRSIEDSEVWDIQELQTLSLEEAEVLRFELTAGVQLFEFEWNVDAIEWKDLAPEKGARPVVVYRDDYSPTYQDLEIEQLAFLKRVAEKPLLTELVAEFQGSHWMQWLAQFAADGVLRRQKSE